MIYALLLAPSGNRNASSRYRRPLSPRRFNLIASVS